MAKFICSNCKKEHEIGTYITSVRNDEKVYSNKRTKKELICDCKNNTVLTPDESEFNGFCTTFGKFASSTPEQRQEILKKRSKEHFKKDVTERKYQMNKDLVNKFKSEG